jgi:hypothetical protein
MTDDEEFERRHRPQEEKEQNFKAPDSVNPLNASLCPKKKRGRKPKKLVLRFQLTKEKGKDVQVCLLPPN